jgi:hypothetical protein
MRIFSDKETARRYVELLYASQDTPLFDMLVKDTWENVKRTLPGVRAEFFAGLQEKGLLQKYLQRAEELAKEEER